MFPLGDHIAMDLEEPVRHPCLDLVAAPVRVLDQVLVGITRLVDRGGA